MKISTLIAYGLSVVFLAEGAIQLIFIPTGVVLDGVLFLAIGFMMGFIGLMNKDTSPPDYE